MFDNLAIQTCFAAKSNEVLCSCQDKDDKDQKWEWECLIRARNETDCFGSVLWVFCQQGE